jgi:hypothetical protein
VTNSRARGSSLTGRGGHICLIAAAAVSLVLAGCSSNAELSTDTLPPLISGPTSFPPVSTVAPDTTPASTLPGETTAAPSTLPATTTTTLITTTTASPTTAPVTTVPATASAAVKWGGWGYYEVPQMGSESVRGTGCGSTGGLGEVIPDGIWNVIVGDGSGSSRFWTSSKIQVDVRCVYTGSGGQSLWNTTCSATPEADACQSQSPTWFVVNANSRLRTMPVAAGVQYGVGALGSTPCPGVTLDRSSPDAAWRFMDSWIVISGGAVTTVVAACPAG